MDCRKLISSFNWFYFQMPILIHFNIHVTYYCLKPKFTVLNTEADKYNNNKEKLMDFIVLYSRRWKIMRKGYLIYSIGYLIAY